MGYPLEGLRKHISDSLSEEKLEAVLQARLTQGIREMNIASPEERAMVISRWREFSMNHTSVA